MKEFFKKLIDPHSNQSHKRVIVILFALNLMAFCYISTFTQYHIPDFMFESICGVVVGGMGLTLFDKKKNNNTPPQ